MTPAALSRITWDAHDRQAWNDAYAHARAIDRRRKRRERLQADKRYDVVRGPFHAYEQHSVHADCMDVDNA